jgi:hypothetical protein
VGLGGQVLYLVLAAAGAPFEDRAAAIVERFASSEQTIGSPSLWALGLWAAKRGDEGRLREYVDTLSHRASTRLDSVVWHALRPHLLVLQGDTTQAIEELTRLTPNASPADLEWQPWEGLGSEKILLAQLLLSRREYERALAVAAQFDSPQPVIYGVYLPASLSLRARAADGLGRTAAARIFRARLQALRPGWPGSHDVVADFP